MRRILLALTLAVVAAPVARAHPGPGLVVDRDGTVYFVVLGSNAIMRRTPDGRVSTFVNDERLRLPHHLVLGADGSLYAASDNTGTVWRIARDGSLEARLVSTMLPAHRGRALQVGAWGDPFTLDAEGNVYAVAPEGNAIVRVTRAGEVTRIADSAAFGNLHFSAMSWGADGALYVSDTKKIWRIVGDRGEVIVPHTWVLTSAMGLAVDSASNIYVADYRGGRVVRLAGNGADNTPSWLQRHSFRQAVGVALAGRDLYVLQSRPFRTVLWRVNADHAERLYIRRDSRLYAQWAFFAAIAVLPLLIVARYRERRSRR